MLGMLRSPPEAFADVVRTHFRLKARSIIAQLDDWLKLDDGKSTASDGAQLTGRVNSNQGGSGNGFKRDVEDLKLALRQLQQENNAGPSSSSANQ